MRILVVNAGSTSLKLAVVVDRVVERPATIDGWDGEDLSPLTDFAAASGPVDAVGHRVVHGGADHTAAVVLDDGVISSLASLTPLAPLHQPRSLAGVRAAREVLPGVPHLACFDTAFHTTMPTAARTYAVPGTWRQRWPIERYGFHGLSHDHASREGARLAGLDLGDSRIVTCHLGGGSSLSAIVDGRSVDTTMGFSPLEGLVMQTRSGDVDPGLVLWLIEHGGLTAAEVRHGLEQSGGMAGLASSSGDMIELQAHRAAGDADAEFAFDVFMHRLVRGIGAMAASAGGVDLLVFTGGIGEHDEEVRRLAVDRVAGALGDPDVLVVDSGEEIEIARQCEPLVST